MKRIVKVFWKDPQDRRVEINYEAESISDEIEVWRDSNHTLYFHKEYAVALYELRYIDSAIPMTYCFSEAYENCYVQDHDVNFRIQDDHIKKIRAMIDSSLAKLIVT